MTAVILAIPSTFDIAARSVRIALDAYNGLARRPRSRRAWVHVQCLLWNARQDAVRAGVLDRKSDSYRFLSDRLHDANRRIESADLRTRMWGIADPRV